MEGAIVLKVILCSVGRRVELAQHFVESVRRLAPSGSRVVGLDIDPLAPGLRFVDERVLVPRVGTPEFLRAMHALAASPEATSILIVPLSDREIAPLADLAETIGRTGVSFAVVPPSAVPIVNDKWLTMQFFESLGLERPQSWLPDCGLEGLPFPLFAKPRGGSASEGAVRIDSESDARALLPRIDQPIVQKLITGPEVTTDVICSLKGDFIAAVSRRRIQVRGGEVMKSVTIDAPEIHAACRRIAASLPARGPITVQAFETENGFVFSEINARLGGGSPLAIAAGVPITDLLVLEAIGAAAAGERSYQSDLYMTRYDMSEFSTGLELSTIADRDLRS